MSVIKLCCSSVKSGFKESAASLSIIRLACAGRNPVRFAGRPTLRFLGVLAANGLSWLNVLSSKRIISTIRRMTKVLLPYFWSGVTISNMDATQKLNLQRAARERARRILEAQKDGE